ncbi:NAD-dependent epimerase/dehydratase family protein [Pedobacter sp. GR22-6]|uniref:NAD-dependent epimerase/dehydratase family protein n=1 Tax=Pedobacter sp. GR22-6 TaxID=3127957 RepID=UPI00307F1C00
MRILITGSSGFVGQNLIKYLSAKFNFDITRVSRSELISADFSDTFAVVHLAGKAHDLKNSSNANEYYKVNYELTKGLFDKFLSSDAKKFIFISSVKAAADTVDGILTEDVFPSPVTDYGKSKLMAEQYIQSQILPIGKFYYILRPCMIHGPGNKGNLNLLYKFVQKGIPYPLASFDNKRSFLSVGNLCFVIVKLLQQEVASGIYNVADDDPLSTTDVIRLLANSSNKKPKLWAVCSRIILGLAKLGDIFKLPLNTERLNKLTENYIVSNAKVKDALGVNLPLNVEDGLKITASSFMAEVSRLEK